MNDFTDSGCRSGGSSSSGGGHFKQHPPHRGHHPSSSAAAAASPSSNSKTGRSSHDDSEESGVGHEEEEELTQLLVELLSNVRTPRVSELTARSALLAWGPPVRGDVATDCDKAPQSKFDALEPISDADYSYEVLLSDKGPDSKYRAIFSGRSTECKLTDLKPCTEYHIRIHALYDAHRGEF